MMVYHHFIDSYFYLFTRYRIISTGNMLQIVQQDIIWSITQEIVLWMLSLKVIEILWINWKSLYVCKNQHIPGTLIIIHPLSNDANKKMIY